EQERRRVLEGGVDAHRGVGRARASRDEGDAGAAGELSVGIRHVRGAAFVPADDDADLFLRVVQGVEKTEVAFARDAEDVVGALGDEGPGQDLAAGAGEGGGGEHGGGCTAAPGRIVVAAEVVGRDVIFNVDVYVDVDVDVDEAGAVNPLRQRQGCSSTLPSPSKSTTTSTSTITSTSTSTQRYRGVTEPVPTESAPTATPPPAPRPPSTSEAAPDRA